MIKLLAFYNNLTSLNPSGPPLLYPYPLHLECSDLLLDSSYGSHYGHKSQILLFIAYISHMINFRALA